MKKDEFLITTRFGAHRWSETWDGCEPRGLDYPVYWHLEASDGQGLQLRARDGTLLNMKSADLLRGDEIALPAIAPDARQFSISVQKLTPIRPAFMPVRWQAGVNYEPGQCFLSEGIHELLIGFGPIEAVRTAKVEGRPIFNLQANAHGFAVTSLQSDLKFKVLGEKSKRFDAGTTLQLREEMLVRCAFLWGSYWWRINSIPEPELLPPDDFEDEDRYEDSIPLHWIARITASLLLSILIVTRIFYALNEGIEERDRISLEKEVAVELHKPKVLPKLEVPPKPVAPTPPKPVVIKETPKPAPKLVKKDPPKRPVPVPVAKVPPEKKIVQAPPKQVPKAAPVPHVAPPVPVARVPNPAADLAKQKANVAKSLNFLNSGPAANANPLAKVPGGKFAAKYDSVGHSGLAGAKNGAASLLNKLGSATGSGDGVITTKGARNLASDVSLQGTGRGKALNDVQGKVSLNALYGNGGGEGLGDALGGQSLPVSGVGKLSDALIQKTLAKYLAKFQYCYEKALLSDSSLSGSVMMQWSIVPGGSVTGAQVVKTQINHAGLKNCLRQELSAIVFPSPTGGAVMVKYPFNFTSSGL